MKPLPIKAVQAASVSWETGTKEISRDDLPENYKQVNVRLGKLTPDDLDKISNRIIHISSATNTKLALDMSDASIAIYGVEWNVWEAEAQLTQLLDEARRFKAKGRPLDIIPEAAELLGATRAADPKDGAYTFEVDLRIMKNYTAVDLQDQIRALLGGDFGPKVQFQSPNIVYYFGRSLNHLNGAYDLLHKWQSGLLNHLEKKERRASSDWEFEKTESTTNIPSGLQGERRGKANIKADEKDAAKHDHQLAADLHIQPSTLIETSGSPTPKVAAATQSKPTVLDFVDILSHSSVTSPPSGTADDDEEAMRLIGDTFPFAKQILLQRQVLDKLQYARPQEHARLLEGLPAELEKKFHGRIKFQWIQKKWAMKIRGEKGQVLEQAEKAYQAEYKRLKDLAATIHLSAKNKAEAGIAPEPTKPHGNVEQISIGQKGKASLYAAKEQEGGGNDAAAESGDENVAIDLGRDKIDKPKEAPTKGPADVQAQHGHSTESFIQQFIGPSQAPALQPASKPGKLQIEAGIEQAQTKQADEWDVDSPEGSVWHDSASLPAAASSSSVRPAGGQEPAKGDANPVRNIVVIGPGESIDLRDSVKKRVPPAGGQERTKDVAKSLYDTVMERDDLEKLGNPYYTYNPRLMQKAIRAVENEQKMTPVSVLTPGAARTGSSSAKVAAAGKEGGKGGTASEQPQPKSDNPKPPPLETDAPKTTSRSSDELPTKIHASEGFDNDFFAVDKRQGTVIQMGQKLSLIPERDLERVAKRIVQLGKDCGVDVKVFGGQGLVLLRADNKEFVNQCLQRIEAYLMGVTDGVMGKEKEPNDTKPSTSTARNAPAARTPSPLKDRSPERRALSVTRPKTHNPSNMPPPQAQYYRPPILGYGPQMEYGYNPYGAAPGAGVAGQGPASYWNWWGYGRPAPPPGYEGFQQGYPHQGYNGYHGQGFPQGHGGEYPGGAGRR
ncbi:hypothetical protein HK097_007423 [Rhizophlyctis rosea]|uniref:Uncharacterized protein n=1 Tax=Rhizophlyctis rosea TaxID=64517 RepID=A0AAD5SDW6_9FUNG|nr:hypothetical protein HK097_007423 [Rhizophlyctis rosea]